MQLKRVMYKQLVPMLETVGFSLTRAESGDYRFKNPDIGYDIHYGFHWLDRRKLFICISSPVDLHREMDDFPLLYPSNGHYADQAELNEIACRTTRNIIQVVIPYMLRLDKVFARVSPELYRKLADNPKIQAEPLVQKHLETIEDIGEMRRFMHQCFNDFMPGELEQRPVAFAKHLDKIIGLAAFWGEWFQTKDRTLEWRWTDLSDLPARARSLPSYYEQFGLDVKWEEPRAGLVYDPLDAVIYEWNKHGMDQLKELEDRGTV